MANQPERLTVKSTLSWTVGKRPDEGEAHHVTDHLQRDKREADDPQSPDVLGAERVAEDQGGEHLAKTEEDDEQHGHIGGHGDGGGHQHGPVMDQDGHVGLVTVDVDRGMSDEERQSQKAGGGREDHQHQGRPQRGVGDVQRDFQEGGDRPGAEGAHGEKRFLASGGA